MKEICSKLFAKVIFKIIITDYIILILYFISYS